MKQNGNGERFVFKIQVLSIVPQGAKYEIHITDHIYHITTLINGFQNINPDRRTTLQFFFD